MQKSSYSVYNTYFQSLLTYIGSFCGVSVSTGFPPPLLPPILPPTPFCVSGDFYTTVSGDSCDSIAIANSVSSAALFKGNPAIFNCSSVPAGLSICLPLTCSPVYQLQANDTCVSIDIAYNIGDIDSQSSVQNYNSWINSDCSNLQQASTVYGHVLCLSPQGANYTGNSSIANYNPNPYTTTAYGDTILPPPVNSTVAPNSTRLCGGWYVAEPLDTCANVAVGNGITYSLFLAVNPTLPPANCTSGLVTGSAYCVHPLLGWNTTSLSDLIPSNDPGVVTVTQTSSSSTSTSALSSSTTLIS